MDISTKLTHKGREDDQITCLERSTCSWWGCHLKAFKADRSKPLTVSMRISSSNPHTCMCHTQNLSMSVLHAQGLLHRCDSCSILLQHWQLMLHTQVYSAYNRNIAECLSKPLMNKSRADLEGGCGKSERLNGGVAGAQGTVVVSSIPCGTHGEGEGGGGGVGAQAQLWTWGTQAQPSGMLLTADYVIN